MSSDLRRRQHRISNRLHPMVYKIAGGLSLWLILSVWGFVGAGGRTGFALTVVSIFIGVVLMLLLVLWRIGRRHRVGSDDHDQRLLFGEWATGDFVTQAGRVKARDAALMLLLPIVAVSLGMTIFAIVLHTL